MKNLRYIPYLRNRYFEGKLLTAEDFTQEQKYMNDKRRLHNRYLHGAGVVSGLEVIRIDDYNVSLEMGVALDPVGREIVVEAPVILKLSLLDGYKEAASMEGIESMYLCIEYQESGVEPVHNLLDQSVHTSEETEYNKYREGYHVYVTDDSPAKLETEDGAEDRFRYLSGRAERIDQMAFGRGICLAKIWLVKAGEFYMIDRLEPMPGKQYACCTPYIEVRTDQLSRRVEQLEHRLEQGAPGEAERSPSYKAPKPSEDWQFAQGSAVIPVPEHVRQGQCLYSDEIAHGLGLGQALILLQVVRDELVYGGDRRLFSKENPAATTGYRLNRRKGTFVIGVCLGEDPPEGQITVNWTALRSRRRNEIMEHEPRIYIRPPMLNMKVRQEYLLEAVCVNIRQPLLEWTVVSPNGGTVDEDGLYRAPSHSGVFEVAVTDCGETKARASVFIVVRDEDEQQV